MNQILKNKKIDYYKYVFDNKIKSDIDIVASNKIIKAHKLVLGQQNLKFSDLLLSQPDLDRIEISNLDPNAVGTFIDYLYTGEFSAGDVNEELYLVADKYWDPKLKDICREKLLNTLSTENVVRRLLLFFENNETKVFTETKLFLAQNYNYVKIHRDFDQVLQQQKVLDSLFDDFDKSNVTVLTKNEERPSRKTLIDSATKSDLTIKVQNRYFLVHKEILSDRNSVFETTLTNLFSTHLNIPDFNPETFEIFLKHIYGHEFDLTNVTVDLLKIAHNYVDEKLKQICEDHLVSTVCETNAIKLLVLSMDVGCHQLEEKATKFIVENFEMMNTQADFEKHQHNPKVVGAIYKVVKPYVKTLSDSLKIQKSSDCFSGLLTVKVPITVGKQHSEKFYINSVPWTIFLHLEYCTDKFVGIYLRCEDENLPFKHEVLFSLRLDSSINAKYNIRFNDTHTFFLPKPPSHYRSYGRTEFISLASLHDVDKGYIRDGKVDIKVDAIIMK